MEKSKQHHYVLVHGACTGAWSWFRIMALLTAAGHRVTAVDLAASGIRPPEKVTDVGSFAEYSEPLMEVLSSVPRGEKIVLVGHSFGGMSTALAADRFPQKIAVIVFVTAFLPDTSSPPSKTIDQFYATVAKDGFLDSELTYGNGHNKPPTTISFGPKFMAAIACHQCPLEDMLLGSTLARVGSTFNEDLSKLPPFTKEGYGSVPKAYITCTDDKLLPLDFQKWMIKNSQVNEVKEIEGADHVPMSSKPQELFEFLLEAGERYQ